VTAPAYLDHAATSPLRAEVRAALLEVLDGPTANPTGTHAPARAARRRLDDARESVAASLGCRPGEVVFTSGGTESDNLAVLGFDGPVACAATEHHAVLDAVRAVGGAVVGVEEPLPRSGLVSVMAVNNETGAVADLEAIDAEVLHTDAVQAVRWLDVASAARRCDLISVSGHKLGAPVGIGALVVRGGVSLRSRAIGGGQERERRAGTANVAGAVALAVALQLAVEERVELVERTGRFRARLLDGLRVAVAGLVETVPDGVPGIVHVCVPGVESEALLFLLDEAGVCASAASSCASGAQQSSHVLAAMGVDPALARGSLRLSMGPQTTDADIDLALTAIPDAVAQLRAAAEVR
jgi:cysteine desulfurase